MQAKRRSGVVPRVDPDEDGLAARWGVLSLLLSGCISALACAPTTGAELLHLHGVTDHVIEPGGSLEITGEALPLDRSGRCQLVGDLHMPGRAPLSVDVELPVRVTSSSLARSLPLTHSAPIFARGGSFVGRLQISFASATGTRVTGRLPEVRFDVRASAAAPLAERLEAKMQAREFAASVGLSFEAAGSEADGLVLRQVAPESDAARAGLQPGDTVSALGELHLFALSDFRPAPSVEEIDLRIDRAGATRHVLLPVGAGDNDPLRGVALAFAGLLLSLSLLLSPLTAGLDPTRPKLGASTRWRLRHLLYFAAATGALFASARVLASVDLDLLVCAAALMFLGAAAAFDARASTKPPALRVLGRLCIVETPTLLAVTAILLSFGASRPSELQPLQLTTPAGWALSTNPLATLAAATLFLGLAHGSAGRAISRAGKVLFALRRVLGAALFVTLFCGGSALALSGPTGALVFSLEGVLLLLLLEAASQHFKSGRLLLAGLASTTLALTLAPADLRADLPRDMELAGGLLLTLALFGLVFASRLRRRTATTWLVHPFL
ncbi:MAG: hypothetical protein GXP55_21100 [Deltaproteobacteria bacterium]|nr:hypothetical protein [Deltaproteobacteria bacterium]